MNKIRARYEKMGRVKYLGHLEIIKVFERAFRRSRTPLKYSEGFNPHPKMSFALPSSVGFSSRGEYIDVELTEFLEIEDFISRMNANLPEGLGLLKAGYVDQKAKSLMSLVDFSEYKIDLMLESPMDPGFVKDFDALLRSGPILMKKRTKSGKSVEKDLKEDIRSHEILTVSGDVLTVKVMLTAGSRGNLNPALLLKGAKDALQRAVDPYKTEITRLDLYEMKSSEPVSLQETFTRVDV